MKTKKNFAELLGLTGVFTSIIGMIVLIISMLANMIFFKETNQILDFAAILGSLAFMLPFFLFQFIMPSGLLRCLDTDIPFWGKVVFYLMVFPFANAWMLSGADAIFHFLPDFLAAMDQGADRLFVRALREQWYNQASVIIVIAYISMLGAGLLFRGIFGNKLKAKTA